MTVSKKFIESDLARIDAMKDSDIDYSDIPPLGNEFLTMATTPWPPKKAQVTVRIDQDVLDWLKGMGKGYQTRLNHILRIAMEHQPGSGTRKP
jgi:uncharacterized protein (DUF4415 family)